VGFLSDETFLSDTAQHREPMVGLTMAMYEICAQYLREILSAEFGGAIRARLSSRSRSFLD
jgi:hypothetical protein